MAGSHSAESIRAKERSSLKEVLISFKRAFLSLFLIFIVIGGILRGIFTATEAAAISVVYALILSSFIYREVKIKMLPALFLQTGITTAVVMLLIGAGSGMGWILTVANIPEAVSSAVLRLSINSRSAYD